MLSPKEEDKISSFRHCFKTVCAYDLRLMPKISPGLMKRCFPENLMLFNAPGGLFLQEKNL